MARFTVRVELHDASWEQYNELHKKMSLQGFTDTIEGESKTVQMPPAEYNFEGSVTRQDVLDRAKNAASSVVKKYGVLVTESAGRTWYGLEEA
ncbi:hypothetical protein [Methylophilus sp. 3sh_L]|uniref:hypothetical protein n=1 Tax=Methylophilus sp. 3sh_L TaxID=3377114 RepID=UPI00398ED9F5